jgi:hypothetical protein
MGGKNKGRDTLWLKRHGKVSGNLKTDLESD